MHHCHCGRCRKLHGAAFATDLMAAIDEGVPAPVLSAALYARFASRGESEYAEKIQSAMRFYFGGHHEKKA